MLSMKLKPIDEITASTGEKFAVIYCFGCCEISYAESELTALTEKLSVNGKQIKVIRTHNACNETNIEQCEDNNTAYLNDSDTILVMSCGVGVQTITRYIEGKNDNIVSRTDTTGSKQIQKITAACDTYNLPGYQGLTPALYDCAMCGECHLNDTGGICPVTSCAKSLINGTCGGSKDGKCEVNPDIQCGWERIYKRMSNE